MSKFQNSRWPFSASIWFRCLKEHWFWAIVSTERLIEANRRWTDGWMGSLTKNNTLQNKRGCNKLWTWLSCVTFFRNLRDIGGFRCLNQTNDVGSQVFQIQNVAINKLSIHQWNPLSVVVDVIHFIFVYKYVVVACIRRRESYSWQFYISLYIELIMA